MSTSAARLSLTVDVFALPAQRALALPSLNPSEFVAAILREFTDLAYLGDDPATYLLVRADNGTPLRADVPLGEQLGDGAQLRLCEREVALPPGRSRPGAALYLHELARGKVFRLAWLPALIGRYDSRVATGEPLAVDLASHPGGPRVSRRHALIVEEHGRYFVERLGANPLAVRSQAGSAISVEAGRHPLTHGDVLLLEHSEIALQWIVREPEELR